MTEGKPSHPARVWEEDVTFPTYGVGEPDKNPMFLEKRVYQGSSGRVYPYPFTESVSDAKTDRRWRAVFLENEYLKVMVLPEIGGRIHMACDKTNGYHFIYYNQVIKPALVGLAGPWISGGIEFNWPQHHRPSTFLPVDYRLEQGEDGSATVWVGEIEQMSRLRGLVAITLRPGTARIDITGTSGNRTDTPQTMLWWANPAVAVNDDYQSVFPPDVQAVMDHGKRDVSRFPIATGVYYNQDYSAGVDISWYKNIPVPTSYMVASSRYDFCGGYDHGRRAGVIHVADRHVSPGKKQWTWGAGNFGQVWCDHLTDEDGPYIELMTGVYTDNQPDFAWLQPGEVKHFEQHFYPCREIGYTRNANREAALGLEVADGRATFGVYSTTPRPGARVELRRGDAVVFECTVDAAPDAPFTGGCDVGPDAAPWEFRLVFSDASGNEVIAWSPEEPRELDIPAAATAARLPGEIRTVEELWLTGMHLEQYRHATRDPEPYYEEGLRRDPGDARCNTALGSLKFRRADLGGAEAHFRRAHGRLTLRNGNPYDGEALYFLGLSLEYQGRFDEAYDAYAKSAWNDAQQHAAYYCMARLDARAGRWGRALENAGRSLERGVRNYRARHLKAAVLRHLGLGGQAAAFLQESLQADPLDYGALYEEALLAGGGAGFAAFDQATRGNVQTLLEVALDYAAAGLYAEATGVLERACGDGLYPMAGYLLGDFAERAGDAASAATWRGRAAEADPSYCFPNRLEEALALRSALRADPDDAMAAYYLGNYYYDRKRWADATELWERTRQLRPGFPTARRNLALSYYNKGGDAAGALRELEAAFRADESDARVFFEWDQLRKKTGVAPAGRLELLDQYPHHVAARDDLSVERAMVLNALRRHREALDVLTGRNFHPWEGGEGKVTGQYVFAHLELARQAVAAGDGDTALEHIAAARTWPRCLGEGRLTGIQENHIDYFEAQALGLLGRAEDSRAAFERAASGNEHLGMSMFYYDQPPDMLFYQGLASIETGDETRARSRFNRLVDYGEQHLNDKVAIDYFAISLPDFLVFDDDLDARNRVHCLYLIALGSFGRGDLERAGDAVRGLLELDPNHQGGLSLGWEIERHGGGVA